MFHPGHLVQCKSDLHWDRACRNWFICSILPEITHKTTKGAFPVCQKIIPVSSILPEIVRSFSTSQPYGFCWSTWFFLPLVETIHWSLINKSIFSLITGE